MIAAASAVMQYQSTRDQAKMGQAAAAIKDQQLRTEQATQAVAARQQEQERQRRADITRGAGIAGAAAAGIDFWNSPTAATVDADNNQLVASDISSIQLLGRAKQNQMMLQGRANQLESNAYSAMASNAWIAPTLGFAEKVGSQAAAGASGGKK